MIKRTLVAAALAFALASGGAQATNIVDTGTPGGWGLTFDKTQYFAGEFSLLDDSSINGIQGYFATAAGNVGISVLSNFGDLPGSVLYSTNLVTTAGAAAWRGVSGLDWSLAAGTYWVAFTPDFTSAYNEIVVGAATPLLAYAQHGGSGDWQAPLYNLGLGVRIDGVAAVAADVPEPTSIALCALGLAGLAVVARRRTKA
ncbi:MAG TPA: PEP-CTERM sorting domain-containing protein [Rhodocyclaceae bacterium]|nr:PEP-CTERM sorting domain-containing protein [Rhodocyclaceae bacterium]